MRFCSEYIRAVAVAAAWVILPIGAVAQTTDNTGPTKSLIVQWKPSISALSSSSAAMRAMDDVGARAGAQLRPLRPVATGAEVLAVEGPVSSAQLEAMAAELAQDPSVEYAEVNRMLRHTMTPTDTRYSEQWHYFEPTGGINAPAAWDVTNGAGVNVAVIDTGYRPHVDLAPNIVGGYDLISSPFAARDGGGRDSDAQDPGDWIESGDPCTGIVGKSSWHGTHVSGTVAAVTNNGSGVAGVAFGARVVPVRAVGRCGGLLSDIADAIIWAAGGTVNGVPVNTNSARVINMSLAGPGFCGTTLQNAINSARSRGTVVIVAAGNGQQDALNWRPANCHGVIVVAAVDRTGSKAWYSNFGSVVDVAAPGGDTFTTAGVADGVLSTFNSGATTPGSDIYAFAEGTSMATPHVAGVVALMLARNPRLSPDQVESRLKGSTRPFPGTCSQCGTGIVNALAAVNAAPEALLHTFRVGGGSVVSTPAGIDCSAYSTVCLADFVPGTPVFLRALGGVGSDGREWDFDHWEGDGCSGQALDCLVTMDHARDVTAVFVTRGREPPSDL